MKKSILALAAIAAAGLMGQAPEAEAQSRGLRIGVGFGSVYSARPSWADPTILQKAEAAQERVRERERRVMAGGRQQASSNSNPGRTSVGRDARRQAAAAAAKAKAEKLAAAAEARRQAQAAAAAARVQSNTQTAKPSVAPGVAATPIAATPSITGDRQLDAAQAQQKAKADEVLKAMHRPVGAAAPAVQPARQSPSEAAQMETTSSSTTSSAAVRVVAPTTSSTATAAPAKPIAAECLRFIPGAGVTVKVSCSE